jgi:hypothetical protein
MSPPNPQDEPVHKGLHDLGRQIEEAESGASREEGSASADPASRGEPPTPPVNAGADAGGDDDMPWPSPPPAEAPAEARAAAGPRRGEAEDAAGLASQAEPADNPVERGLHELGRQIEESGRGGSGGGGSRRGNGGPAHAAPKNKRSSRRKVAYVLGSIFLVLVLIAGAVGGYAWYLNHQIHRISLHNLSDSPSKGADAGTENILMIGSTSRCALKVQNPQFGLCSQGVTGVNSDVVMILHLNPANNSLSILSIPRDLFVPNARSDGANKIDAALYQ